jgi:sulfatase modifying factor 1
MKVMRSKFLWLYALPLLVVAAMWFGLGASTSQHAKAERLSCPQPVPTGDAAHPGMVWVPGGSFTLGDTVYPEEQPLRPLMVQGFWMDRTEVTNDQFAQFVEATGYVTVAERAVDLRRHPGMPTEMQQPGAVVFVMPNDVQGNGSVAQWWRYTPGANWRHPGGPATSIKDRGAFPVVAVTYEDAVAYAKWKGPGYSLPTEAQWEWAALGGQTQAPATHDQPKEANTWQGLFPVVNSAEDGFIGLAPVGCYAANGYGLHDMVGNVWEITTDAFKADHTGDVALAPDQVPPDLRPAGTMPERRRVIKGGSFLCAPNYCMRYRAGSRQPQEEDLAVSHLGFRTIAKGQ